jgi:5-carboxymethyl-2-hydroxymuconate isomerase
LFNNYSANVRDFFQSAEGGVDEKRKQDLEDLFNRTRKPEFISEIEKRHLELSNELKDIESELSKKKIKEWSTGYASL